MGKNKASEKTCHLCLKKIEKDDLYTQTKDGMVYHLHVQDCYKREEQK
jgi:hypothetical protein